MMAGGIERRAGDADSYLCVTAWRGKFVKFRMTVAQRPGNDAEAERFIAAGASRCGRKSHDDAATFLRPNAASISRRTFTAESFGS